MGCDKSTKYHKEPVHPGPDLSLLLGGEPGFNGEGVANQREQGTAVGKGKESVGKGTAMCFGVPGLEQWAGGGEKGVGESDADEQQCEDL